LWSNAKVEESRMWGFAIYGNKLPRTATNCDCDRGLEHTEGLFGKNGLTPQPRRLFLLSSSLLFILSPPLLL